MHSASSDTDTDLIELLVNGGGTPAHPLNDPQLRRRLLQVLRADLELAREAVRDFEEVHVRVPLFVLGGDADDPAPAQRLPLRAARTTDVCELELLPGGHFTPFMSKTVNTSGSPYARAGEASDGVRTPCVMVAAHQRRTAG